MSLSAWIFCLAIFIQAMPSWAQGNSVSKDGKEWLQPADFVGYTSEQVSSVCPSRACSGMLPGSTVDLTGYIWASVEEVNSLFNAYGVDPPFTGPDQYREDQEEAAQAFFTDFRSIDSSFGDNVWASMAPDSARLDDSNVAAINSFGSFWNNFDYAQGATGVWFYKPLFKVYLEEPVNEEIHSGIGNLRGWAVSGDGIDRVEIYINGKYMYDAPYGGERTDVGEQYPHIAGSDNSGFSLAFGYSNLGVGEHTIMARAFNNLGEVMDSTANFEVVAFHKDFINKWDIVDTSQATMTATGDEILLDNVSVDGQPYELRLKWRTAEQGFEIIEIR